MKMKKITAVLLAASLTLSMGTTVFASEAAGPTLDNNTAQIKATYQSETEIPEVYYVDVEWGSLEYTYHSGITRTWNPQTLTFKEKTENAGWGCDTGADTITVTNHSNMGITASFSYAAKDGSDITGTFSQTSFNLPAPEEDSAAENAPNVSTVLTLSGELSDTVTDKTPVGEVTVTIQGGVIAWAGKPENTPLYTTDTPGVYRATCTAEGEKLGFYFTVGDTIYGIWVNSPILAERPKTSGASYQSLTVTPGHTYEFIFNINDKTYTYEDITPVTP